MGRSALILLASLLYAGESRRYLDAFPGTTPVIDGKFSPGEWSDASPIRGVIGWTQTFSPTLSREDLNLRGYVKHDGKRLYFAFDIDDDILYGIDTPRWLPKENPKAHEFLDGKPSREAFPWFGDEMEILLNAAYQWKGTESVQANGRSWQMVVNLTKSRLGGLNVGGLLEGEPRRDPKAFATYSQWIDSGAMTAATAVKPNGRGYVIEWSIAFDPCVEVEPAKFWSPALGDRPVGINIALGDLDRPEDGEGNFGNFHHEDWFAGGAKTRTQLKDFGTLMLRTKRPATSTLSIRGTHFYRNEKHFPLTGVSFFNAIYNPAFNQSSDHRRQWLRKFQSYGINTLRIWSQWDNKRGFVNTCPECSLYRPDGSLRADRLATLKEILADCDREGMAVELVFFSQESWHDGIKLGPAADSAVAALARELLPYRNVIFQVWNEFSERILDHVKTIRAIDPTRIVTNSPGVSSFLGDPPQNAVLDFLSPHTTRQAAGKPWIIAPDEIRMLLSRYKKPVVDDEPARTGTGRFGGPPEPVSPFDHIIQIAKVWELGGYVVYHHDMFQMGQGDPTVPPTGIPDPEFSPFHKQVFEFLKQRDRYVAQPLD
jgi:SSS family solute:Na+ symporter